MASGNLSFYFTRITVVSIIGYINFLEIKTSREAEAKVESTRSKIPLVNHIGNSERSHSDFYILIPGPMDPQTAPIIYWSLILSIYCILAELP